MKAAIYRKYGPPDVVSIQEIPQPKPGNNDVLIKIHASTLNRTDCGFRSAEYFVSRFFSGLFKPKFPILGSEFAGEIIELGKEVTKYKIGDRVFGFNDKEFGGHAEFMSVSEDTTMGLIPGNLSYTEAAPLLEGSHYAWCDIVAAKVKKGQRVMVYGATGSIGSAAVQLLRYLDTEVTAVCSTNYIDLVKSLGADRVIDYTCEDYKVDLNYYDFIFDSVGKSSFGICKPLLKQNGIYISTELGKNGENLRYALTTKWFGDKKLLFPLPYIHQSFIEMVQQLVEAGKFKPVIDRIYTLDEIVEAYKYVETGQKIGNVIIRI
jgi:NADPH:quinone reductase-like Zn-dependent oxidoreductase